MPEQDFYADPTLFDHWQSRLERWMLPRLEKLAPYAWFIAFSILALGCLAVAAGVFIALLQAPGAGLEPRTWNPPMAQGVTLIVALLASQHLLRQATSALPEGARLPPKVRSTVDLMGGSDTRSHARGPCVTPEPCTRIPETQTGLQEFFAGVRAAGVNVRIAKVLFSAGIRSSRQLVAHSDAQLLAIRGIGPATVRKLRAHFESV